MRGHGIFAKMRILKIASAGGGAHFKSSLQINFKFYKKNNVYLYVSGDL